MAALIDHAPVSMPTGSREFGPANIADGLSSVLIRAARCTTATPSLWADPATTLNASILVSVDGGQSFRFLAGLGANGGIYHFSSGAEAVESTLQCDLPPGVGRQVKIQLTVASGPLVTQLTVETG